MHRCSRLVVFGLTPALVFGAACGGDDAGPSREATSATAAGSNARDLVQGDAPVDLDPAEFTSDIDNEYWPMEPGSRWSYREIDEEGKELQVVITVSTETKEIANGITARVVRDTVWQDGEVKEDTFDWYAQDVDGTIWYLGEDTAEFDDGEISSRAGSFEAGVDGALPGVAMPAAPAIGLRYRQEYYRGKAEDNGEILSVDEQVEVPFGHFERVVLTKDSNTLEPNVVEYKLYAPGVGPVLVLGISGGGAKEELIDLIQVSDEIARAAGTVPLGESYG